MTPNQAAVLRVIEETIAANEVMPTGARIATRSGVKITSVNSAIYQLQDAGIIDIANFGSGKRVVTIMATGEHTAHPGGARKVGLADAPADHPGARSPAPRLTCWRCGATSMAPCRHIERAAA